jgi:putative Holliday junction resolvase
MRRGARLGVDVGTVRIGVASCDRDGLLATPVETVKAEPRRAGQLRLVRLAHEYEVVEVVVGLPRSLSGAEGPAAVKIRAYAAELARRLDPVPVRLVDERLSTVSATQGLRASGVSAKKGRAVVDQAAAVVILQDALDAERASGRPPGSTVQVQEDDGK